MPKVSFLLDAFTLQVILRLQSVTLWRSIAKFIKLLMFRHFIERLLSGHRSKMSIVVARLSSKELHPLIFILNERQQPSVGGVDRHG